MHQVGSLEAGSREEDRACQGEGRGLEAVPSAEHPLQGDEVHENNDFKEKNALGGIIPMPRPAGIPRPGPTGSYKFGLIRCSIVY